MPDVCEVCGESVMPDGSHDHDIDMTEHIVTTKSVNSYLYDGTQGDDPDPSDAYGHITLLDWDEITEQTAHERVDDKDGLTIIAESSENSYHAWNLTVQPRLETMESMVALRDDTAHVRSGLKRRYWRLRYGPKEWGEAGDKIYKEKPELVGIVANATDREQSRPHYRLARALWDIPEMPDEMRRSYNWTGDALDVEQYATLTDTGKEAWNGE